MLIPWKTFTGEHPRTLPHRLPETAAQAASDCDFSQGALCGRLGDKSTTVAGAKSLFFYDTDRYYTWSGDVDAVRGPIANDAHKRFYWSDGAALKVGQATAASGAAPSGARVGVPRPAAAMTKDTVFDTTFPLDLAGVTYKMPLVLTSGADAGGYEAVIDGTPTAGTATSTGTEYTGRASFSWTYKPPSGTKLTGDTNIKGMAAGQTSVQALLAVGAFGAVAVSEDAGDTWTTSKVGSVDLHAVVWSGDSFYAVGDSGVIHRSTGVDSKGALKWNTGAADGLAASGKEAFYGVASGGTASVVAVGANGAVVYMKTPASGASSDPVWARATGAGSATLRAVAYGNNRFVAVGDGGAAAYSTDNGKTWVATSIPGGANMKAISYSGSAFYAVGESGAVYTNSDGASWSNAASVSRAVTFNAVVASGGTVLLAGDNGRVYTGVGDATGVAVSSNPLFALLRASTQYFVAGDAGVLFVSSTGSTWNTADVAGEMIYVPSTTTKDKRQEARPILTLTFAGGADTPAGEVVLREGANASTFPTGFEAYGGSLTITDEDTSYTSLGGGSYTVTSKWSFRFKLWVKSESVAVEEVVYAYAYMNDFGEIGPLSDPLSVSIPSGAKVVVKVPAASFTGWTYRPITKVVIYRSATGGTGTALLFLKEEAYTGAGITVTDDSKGAALGEAASTQNCYPPEEGLKGLCYMGNGIMAAFKENEVHFCDPYLPYAWNPGNIMNTGHKVVSLCPAEGGLFITTVAHPYYITGTEPGGLSQMKVTAIQAGVSKNSICNLGPAVVYASNDGLVTARGLDVSLDLSFKFFTRDAWRAFHGGKLDKMRLSAHDGHLLIWFEDGTPGALLRYDEVEPSFARLSTGFTAAAIHPIGDALYLQASGASTFAEFKAGSGRSAFSWWSRDVILPKPLSFGCAQLVGSGSVTVALYADGVLKHTKTVTATATGATVFRLPGGFTARRWSVKLTGTADAVVTEFNLAATPGELQNV